MLGKILATEPERLLPLLTVESAKTMPFIADFLHPYLVREAEAGRLREGIDLDRSAEYLARSILSLINAPGRWNLDDPAQVTALVRARAPRRNSRVTEAGRRPKAAAGRRRIRWGGGSCVRPSRPTCSKTEDRMRPSRRGELLFRGVVAVLVAAIVVLFACTLATR